MTRQDEFEASKVPLTARLVDAMQALDRGNLQIALVLEEDGRLAGTLTDGDIRRALLRGATIDAPLAPFVHRKFLAVGPEATRTEVIELMRARVVGQVPIVDGDGKLVGLHLLRELVGGVDRPNWAVVMAGGKGTRLYPLTENVPKPMLTVAGRPILERIVHQLVFHGIRRIFLSVNYLSDVIARHFEDGARFGCRIEYLREDKPLGTGGPLSLLPERPTAPLIALNGDLVVQLDLGKMLAFHEQGRYRATVAAHQYTHKVPFGVLDLEGGQVVGMREKPTAAWTTNAGIYVLDPDVLARVPRGVEFPLPGLLEQCLANHEPVGAFLLEGDWIDVGRTSELERARGG